MDTKRNYHKGTKDTKGTKSKVREGIREGRRKEFNHKDTRVFTRRREERRGKG